MPNIRRLDMLLIDDLFEMGGGYVLNFSDRTLAEFFAELVIDIDDPHYARNGTSKAKRLRCFLQSVDVPTAVHARGLVGIPRGDARALRPARENAGAKDRFEQLVGRIQGGASPVVHPPAAPAWPVVGVPSAALVSAILADLMALSQIDPHPRGFAFEKFLKRRHPAKGAVMPNPSYMDSPRK